MDRAGRWVPVPVTDGAFTVNLGDLMMRWTNDRWRSTLHRVVNPPAATNDLSRRLSIGMFFIPNYDAVVARLRGSGRHRNIDQLRPPNYRTSRFASTASDSSLCEHGFRRGFRLEVPSAANDAGPTFLAHAPRKSGSHLTQRWREMDSNLRFPV